MFSNRASGVTTSTLKAALQRWRTGYLEICTLWLSSSSSSLCCRYWNSLCCQSPYSYCPTSLSPVDPSHLCLSVDRWWGSTWPGHWSQTSRRWNSATDPPTCWGRCLQLFYTCLLLLPLLSLWCLFILLLLLRTWRCPICFFTLTEMFYQNQFFIFMYLLSLRQRHVSAPNCLHFSCVLMSHCHFFCCWMIVEPVWPLTWFTGQCLFYHHRHYVTFFSGWTQVSTSSDSLSIYNENNNNNIMNNIFSFSVCDSKTSGQTQCDIFKWCTPLQYLVLHSTSMYYSTDTEQWVKHSRRTRVETNWKHNDSDHRLAL